MNGNEGDAGMGRERTTRDLVLETHRDVKWICRALERFEAENREYAARLRALEDWRSEKRGEERRASAVGTVAGGVVGGAMAVIVKILGGG